MEIQTERPIDTAWFSELYTQNREGLFNSSPGAMNTGREEAFRQFALKGLPGKQTEDYRYTDLSKAFRAPYAHPFDKREIRFRVEDIFRCDIPELQATLALVVNGFFHGDQPLHRLPNGIVYGSMRQAAQEYPDLFARHYGHLALADSDPFTALNMALASDGLFLYIPDQLTVDKPIQVVNLLLSDEALMVQHRNLIVVGRNARVQLVICDHSLSPLPFFTNSVYEVFAEPDAQIDLVRMQNEHNESGQVSGVYIRQAQGSRVSSNTITLHGGFIRNNFKVELAGRGAENYTYGLLLADKTQHITNQTVVDHLVPDCKSDQHFKSILDDQASAAFNGKIMVRRDAQNTLAYQSNKNLLLTTEAVMNTKPQLEIYADDVKCSHGATVGQLDENAMFYIQSRGISFHEARLLMMFGFAHEIINRIPMASLRERIDHLVDLRLRGELSRCHNCPMHCC